VDRSISDKKGGGQGLGKEKNEKLSGVGWRCADTIARSQKAVIDELDGKSRGGKNNQYTGFATQVGPKSLV